MDLHAPNSRFLKNQLITFSHLPYFTTVESLGLENLTASRYGGSKELMRILKF
jgi:hypothetical protein